MIPADPKFTAALAKTRRHLQLTFAVILLALTVGIVGSCWAAQRLVFSVVP